METKQGRKGHLAIQKILTFSQFLQTAPKIATNTHNHLEYKNMNCLEGAVAHGRASSILAFGTIFKESLVTLDSYKAFFFLYIKCLFLHWF